jgi:hypothetical protein
VRKYLHKNQNATARDVVKNCGISLGRVPKMPAWQAHQAQKKQMPHGGLLKETRQLTEKMLAAMGKENDPSDHLDAKEAAWRYLLEKAEKPEERARLNRMTPAEKAEAIALVIDHFADEDKRGKRPDR